MQLAHAGEHHFLGLGVVLEVDGAVLLGNLVERAGELRFVAAGLGRDGQADHRRGELERRQLDFAERRAGVQVFGLGDGDDVAGGRPHRRACVLSPCTERSGPILTPLRCPDACDASSPS